MDALVYSHMNFKKNISLDFDATSEADAGTMRDLLHFIDFILRMKLNARVAYVDLCAQ